MRPLTLTGTSLFQFGRERSSLLPQRNATPEQIQASSIIMPCRRMDSNLTSLPDADFKTELVLNIHTSRCTKRIIGRGIGGDFSGF
ncbi:MAG: hypothetical protein CMN02_11155 [Roseibacillus sp.]|nr:hypothetical protein [Roseibacillus sp.]